MKKLICKKDYHVEFNQNDKILFLKDKEYFLDSYDDNTICLINELGKRIVFIKSGWKTDWDFFYNFEETTNMLRTKLIDKMLCNSEE